MRRGEEGGGRREEREGGWGRGERRRSEGVRRGGEEVERRGDWRRERRSGRGGGSPNSFYQNLHLTEKGRKRWILS